MFENRIDFLRFFLYAVLMVLGLFAYQAWEREHEMVAPRTEGEPSAVISDSPTRYVPNAEAARTEMAMPSVPTTPTTPAAPIIRGKLINVITDNLQLTIDTAGGNLVEAKLLKYKKDINGDAPVVLLHDNTKNKYLAESGLLSDQGPDVSKTVPIYHVEQTHYQFSSDQKEWVVKLHWQQNGISIVKSFTFKPDSYDVAVAYQINNHSTSPWSGHFFSQLLRTDTPPETSLSTMIATYFGGAISSPNDHYQKITFKDMREKNIAQTVQGGWAAMVQHYFVGAWVPPKAEVFDYYSKVTPHGMYVLGMVGPLVSVLPGHTASVGAKLYLGPAVAKYLEEAAPHLKLTIDYGWFWFIADIIFWMMEIIYKVVGNWGLAIILVTVIIKLLFYSLSAKSYRSMSALKQLQPRIEKLREQYGDDKQKLTQATLELYRQEKVNPMSGCLPILIQIPVFIALYWVLVESVQFRHAPFYFWIHDLSQSDPYYVLPILMGLSMFLQQRLNPPPADPMQAKVMMLMPVIFTALFFNFPSGLMIYWIVNNTLSFVQQWYVMRIYKPGATAKIK